MQLVFEIVCNEVLAPQVHRMVVRAPLVAAARKPGQFVIVRATDDSERIPLTIADADPSAGTITLVIQAVGEGTRELVSLSNNGCLRDVAGPLGMPTEIQQWGKVVCVGGGVGTAVLFPLAKGLVEAKNDVTTIIGGRSASYVILRDELSAFCRQVLVATEDGSLGEKGFVTVLLDRLLKDPATRPEAVFAVGPVPMMSAVAELTRAYGVRTIVSLNPIMIDGTGMCGGCRVTVHSQVKFACVDGPEFDGHQVDFRELASRQNTYKEARCHSEKCRLTSPAGQPAGESSPADRDVPAIAQAQSLTPKHRMTIARTTMPEQAPARRAANFEEVNLGLDASAAIREAQRCLQCKARPCVNGCPVHVRIPEFLAALAQGNLQAATDVIRADNALPAIAGRVCPQERQCESQCLRGKAGEPVAIGWLERFVADWASRHAKPPCPPSQESGYNVAVVGSGPGGLAAAGELARKGHRVTVFEALHAPGGVLRYGIPEFRLPKVIVDAEVSNLKAMGVEIQKDVVVGRTLTVPQIMSRFDACFIANGAGLPVFLGIPGENLKGVYSANEYLTRVNLMGAYKGQAARTPVARGSTVLVFGGGNTAMDAVRTALRLESSRAVIAYRRSRAEMPARLEEVRHAEQEGVELLFLVDLVEILGDSRGWVRAVKLQKMELGEPDASGRRRPVRVPGSEFELACDIAVIAIGTQANPLLTATCPQLRLTKRGNIEVDQHGATSMPGVFAGGDIVRGGATVILAMGDGKQAAGAIDGYLRIKRAKPST